MTMAGGAMVGYCEIGSTVIASMPPSRMKSAITQANTGRSMKNLAMCGLRYLDAATGGEVAGAAGPPAGPFHGCGLTVAPGLAFWKPSTTIRSPPLRPELTTQLLPSLALATTG